MRIMTKRRISFYFLAILCICVFGFLYHSTLINVKWSDYIFQESNVKVASEVEVLNRLVTVLGKNLVLIDRTILKRYEEAVINKDEKNVCFFCRDKKKRTVTFAVFQPITIPLKEYILLSTLGTGFQVEKIISSNTKKFSPYHKDLPLGFIINKETGCIVFEIVLLYKRKGDYWWHGSFHQDAQYKSKLYDFHLNDSLALSHESAFEKLQIEPVVIDGITMNIPKNLTQFLKDSSRFIECNYEQADKFYQTYGNDTSEKAVLFADKVRKVLAGAKKALDNLGIPFWLSSGTLLGYYRQCDVIPYTTDVDIEVFIDDYNDNLIQAFKDQHFKLLHIFGKKSDSYELSFWMDGVKIDVFFVYEEGDHFWVGSVLRIKDGVQKYRYKWKKFSLCWTEFLGMKLRIPCEVEDYIKTLYGPDWNKPVKEWYYTFHPYNMEKAGIWNNEEVPEVFQIFPYK